MLAQLSGAIAAAVVWTGTVVTVTVNAQRVIMVSTEAHVERTTPCRRTLLSSESIWRRGLAVKYQTRLKGWLGLDVTTTTNEQQGSTTPALKDREGGTDELRREELDGKERT